MNIKEFKEVAALYGAELRVPNFGYAKMKFIGEQFGDVYTFNYCGISFSIDSRNDYVVVKKIPFEVLEVIYRESPELLAGENPYMGHSDDEYEEDLRKIEGLEHSSSEYNKLFLEALSRRAKRPAENGYVKDFKIKTKEGLIAVMNGLAKGTRTLDGWLKVYGGELAPINQNLRNVIKVFDGVVNSGTTVDNIGISTKITDPKTGNSIINRNNSNDFSCQVRYEVEEGKSIILTHYYSKNGYGPDGVKGEGINIQVLEGLKLVAEINYDFTNKECARFEPQSGNYYHLEVTPDDEKEIAGILQESINYAQGVVDAKTSGRGRV